MTAAHDREPESTISRTEIPASAETRAAFEEFVNCFDVCADDDSAASACLTILDFLDALDKPSAHHRPRLNELLRCAREGLLG